jgi:hypothetical protein
VVLKVLNIADTDRVFLLMQYVRRMSGCYDVTKINNGLGCTVVDSGSEGVIIVNYKCPYIVLICMLF